MMTHTELLSALRGAGRKSVMIELTTGEAILVLSPDHWCAQPEGLQVILCPHPGGSYRMIEAKDVEMIITLDAEDPDFGSDLGRITVDQYERLIEDGILPETNRYELIEGRITVKDYYRGEPPD